MNQNHDVDNRFREKKLSEILSLRKVYFLILHRKKYIYLSLSITILAVFLFNLLSDPIYESTVILKKEPVQDVRSTDEIGKIIAMQTLDEVETEIEIVKSRSVLEKVAEELLLFVNISEVNLPSGEFFESDKSYLSYQEFLSTSPAIQQKFPVITQASISSKNEEMEYNILVSDNKLMTVLAENEVLLTKTFDEKGNISVNFPEGGFHIHWEEPASGSDLKITFKNLEKVLEKLYHSISTKRIGKTNLFQIKVESGSAAGAQIIARTLIEKFREVRLEQKQQTIRYSFNFVDEQLKDTELRLQFAEDTLSKFKSRYQITSIDKNSEEIINFLSKLEGEKVDADLQIAEYENRLVQMKEQHQQRGYFDQTYLTPYSSDESYSPFSALLRELSDLELKKLELLQRRKETHPDVITLNNQIEQVKDKLSTYNQNTIVAYEILLKSLKEKRNNIQKLISSYMAQMGKLPQTETQLTELIRHRNALEKKFSLLLDKREEMRMAELSKLQDIVVIDDAQQPLKPVSPRKKLNLALGLFGGILFGLMLIFAREYFSEKVTDVEFIDKELGLTLLTILPPYSKEINQSMQGSVNLNNRFVTLIDEAYGSKESFRILRMKLQHRLPETKNILLITSGEEGTGKTTVSANLAISMTQAGQKVLLIDGDLRKGTLSRTFNIAQETPGMIEYLKGEKPFSELIQSTFFDQRLEIISAGKLNKNSGELLDDLKLNSFFEAVQSEYDIIIVDSPPVTRVVDPLLLGKIIKNVILVIRPDLTYKETIRGAVSEFRQSEMNFLGVVANSCNVAHSSYRYRYGYGYGYHNQSSGQSQNSNQTSEI